ncbi:MAG: hypothetical protein Q7S27_05920 [Nanoarchaeota archaeon]|nr:hypothetical protein [Nanoarchaeota archaeon]
MILGKKPLTLADVGEYVQKGETKEAVLEYLKKFGKVSKDKADKLKEAISGLNNPKIKDESIVKIIDFIPKDQEDLNKIFLENGLNEEEVLAVLAILKGN